jgi:hypothetical protein
MRSGAFRSLPLTRGRLRGGCLALVTLLLAAPAFAQFKSPDVKPGKHRREPVRRTFFIPTPSAVQSTAVGAFQCLDNLLFPANFAGLFPDANASASCGTNPSESDTYTFKVAGSQIGTVALSGAGSGAVLVQQITPVQLTSTSITGSITVTNAGDALVAEYEILTNSYTASASDNNGGTWTTCGPLVNASGVTLEIYYSLNHNSGATTVTVGTLGASEGQVLAIQEFSGVLTSSALDLCGATGATGNSTSPATGSNGATSHANDLLIGAAALASSVTVSAGPTNSFSGLTASNYGGGSLFPAYEVVSSTGTYSTGWTASSTSFWAGNLLALKTNAPVAGCVPTFTTTNGLPQLCPAGSRLEADAPATASGANVAISLAGHVP